MNILVMGGTGAIGQELVALLSQNNSNKIIVTSRRKQQSKGNVIYIQGDAKDIQFLKFILENNDIDVIVDFMLYTVSEFKERYEMLLSSSQQYIFLSSARVYAPSKEPVKEDSPRLLDISDDQEYLSQGEYSLTKAKQENVLRSSLYKNWIIVRPYKTYSSNRLQLGVLELEQWLYRTIANKTVVVPGNIKDLHTSLTSSKDTARILIYMIGNNALNGSTIQIANPEKITWGEIVNIYSKCIEDKYGRKMRIYYAEDTSDIELIFNNKYRIKYDGLIDRIFDESSVNSIVGGEFDWTPVHMGLADCMAKALESRTWKPDNYGIEGMYDKITREHTSLVQIPGFKNKLKYFIHRNFPEKTINDIRNILNGKEKNK